jgi:hypothetical protein
MALFDSLVPAGVTTLSEKCAVAVNIRATMHELGRAEWLEFTAIFNSTAL